MALWAVALFPLTASVSKRWSRFAHHRDRAFGAVIAAAVGRPSDSEKKRASKESLRILLAQC